MAIQMRRGTAAAWTSANPTLAAGEIGFETDTGKAKIGDGSTAWTALAYSITESTIVLADNTTLDVSSTKHGFAPKTAANAQKFLNSAATPVWRLPPYPLIGGSSLQATLADGETRYWGGFPSVGAGLTSGKYRMYVPLTGTIIAAQAHISCLTAGSAENWSVYIRLNDTTDTLIATVGLSAADRIFLNTGLAIAVNAGDYIEMKEVEPTWATNPANAIRSCWILILPSA
jgi:hypothetical protein